jgi:hypothetical protein
MMEITDRARKLWAWVAEAQYTKSDSEIVAHIALAFIEERQIAFADHGEACEKIVEQEAALCRPSDEPRYIKAGYIALHDAWLQIRALSSKPEPQSKPLVFRFIAACDIQD